MNGVHDLHWSTMLERRPWKGDECVIMKKHRKTLVFSLHSNFVVLSLVLVQ